MNTKLTCLQINLQHCQVASLALAQVILDLDADFIFIQEPYTTKTATTKVSNIPPRYKVYKAINEDPNFGAAILVKSTFKVTPIHQKCGNNLFGLKMKVGNQTYRFFTADLLSHLRL